MIKFERYAKFILCFAFYILFLSFLGCKENLLSYNPFRKNNSEVFVKSN